MISDILPDLDAVDFLDEPVPPCVACRCELTHGDLFCPDCGLPISAHDDDTPG